MGWSSYIEIPGKVMNVYYTLHQLVYQTTDRNVIPVLYASKHCEAVALFAPTIGLYYDKFDSIIRRIDHLPHRTTKIH